MAGLRHTNRDKRLRRLLRTLRQESGVLQEDLAVQLEKPQSYVSKLESGDRKIEFLEVEDICRALAYPLADFIARWEKSRQED